MDLPVARSLLTFLLTLLVSACSPGGVELGPEGGEVHGPRGSKLVIPEGALDRTVTVELRLASSVPVELPSAAAGVPIFEVTPAQLTLRHPVHLELPKPDGHCSPSILTPGPLGGWREVEGGSLNGGASVTPIGHFGIFVAAPPSGADLLGRMFWAEGPHVLTSNLAGGDIRIVAEGARDLNAPWGLAVDARRCRVYWTDNATDAVYSAAFDGSFREQHHANPDRYSNPKGIAVDAEAGKIFFGDGHLLRSANLDGSGLATVSDGIAWETHVSGVAVDPLAANVYWTDSVDDSIHRAAYDGSAHTILYTGGDRISNPQNIFVDTESRSLFWVEWTDVRTANLDGTSPTTVTTGIAPTSVVPVRAANALFWSDNGTDTVNRMSLDGSANVVVHQSADSFSNSRDVAIYVGGN